MLLRRKYTLEGPAVAALGSLAGGYAAKAIMGNTKAPDGGGIPGLTSSKGAGKDGTGPGYAIQVDPSTALNYFSQASDKFESGYNAGLDLYGAAMKKARDEIQLGYTNANNTLKPLSMASGQALNQQMRMLGMDPIQATVGFGDTLRSAFGVVKDSLPREAQTLVSTLATQYDKATNIKDKGERAEALKKIKATIEGDGASIIASLQAQMDAVPRPTIRTDGSAWYVNGSQVNVPTVGYNANTGGVGYEWGSPSNTYKSYGITEEEMTGGWDAVDRGMSYGAIGTQAQMIYDILNARREKQIAPLTAQMAETKKYLSTLNEFNDTFKANYGEEYDAGYTPEQIEHVVTNLPGFQYKLDQGTKAIERQGAARGMLGSGNTLSTLQTYGQGLGMDYYNQYMGYLGGITAQGAPATMQISANQSAEGTALATLAQNFGAAQMDTARQIATFQAQTLKDAGVLFNQTAMFNAQAQNASILQGNAIAAGQANAAISAGPGYMNAQTNAGQLGLAQQAFQAQQLQNAGMVSGFGGGVGQGPGGSTMATSSNGRSSLSFPVGGVAYGSWGV